MATALLRDHALPLLDSDGEGPAALARVLRESPHAAVQLIKSALDGEAAKLTAARPGNTTKLRSRLALVVDKMEEMFTQDGVTAKERKAFEIGRASCRERV